MSNFVLMRIAFCRSVARVFSPAAAILESEKTLGTRLSSYIYFVNPKCAPRVASGHCAKKVSGKTRHTLHYLNPSNRLVLCRFFV